MLNKFSLRFQKQEEVAFKSQKWDCLKNLIRKLRINVLRIHWRLLRILKTSKKMYEVMFLDMQKCVCSESVLNTIFLLRIRIEINKKISFGQKMPSFFFREPQLITVLFLICNFYMSWSTRFVSLKLRKGFYIFDSVLFLLKFIFLFNKMHGIFDFKTS